MVAFASTSSAGARVAARAALVAAGLTVAVGTVADTRPPDPPASDAVVLMYHHVGDDGHVSTRVTEDQFRAHLEYIADNDYTVVPLGEVIAAVEEQAPLPARAVAITFDDGYRSVGEIAHPLLQERGWPYTVFVNTEPHDEGFQGYMTWERMQAMADDGVRFANHSTSHDPLFERREGEDQAAWSQRITEDLQGAQARLEAMLGDAVYSDPPLLAYPYGEYDTDLMALVDALGYVAFGQQSGAIGRHSNRLALPRFAINERYGDPASFSLRLATRALPVVAQSPLNPIRLDAEPPRLILTIEGEQLATHAMGCFYRGEVLEVDWLEPGVRFAVQGEAALPEGRSRYTCTMPDGDGGFYWFSQQWVVGQGGT